MADLPAYVAVALMGTALPCLAPLIAWRLLRRAVSS